jgi:hypothetical protein
LHFVVQGKTQRLNIVFGLCQAEKKWVAEHIAEQLMAQAAVVLMASVGY